MPISPQWEKDRDPLLRLTGEYLRMTSAKYGGKTTLNELRVMNKMIAYFFGGQEAGVVRLSLDLNIHKATVSRCVMSLLKNGHLVEAPHEDDRRRRVISLSESSIKRLDQEGLGLIIAWKGK